MQEVKPFEEAFIRASYRALLQRDPESAVLDAQSPIRIPAEIERRLQQFLELMLSSTEFRGNKIFKEPHFPLETWVTATIENGLKLRVDLGDPYVSVACLQGVYEHRETLFLDNHVKPGSTFVDIGANIGWFAIRAASKVGPSGRVIAFEPRTTTSENLMASIAENGFADRMELHRVALGARAGVQHMGWHKESRNPGGTWFLPTEDLVEAHRRSGGTIQETPVETLDAIIDGRKVDVIKIDVEGAEQMVLNSGVNTLKSARPIVLSEINQQALRIVSKAKASEYIGFFRELGFDCHELGEAGDIGAPLDLAALDDDVDGVMNVIFVPR